MLEFQITNGAFEISILKFVDNQSLTQKQKKLGPKILYLGIFGLQFNKDYYQIFNQHSRICETINFNPKQKNK